MICSFLGKKLKKFAVKYFGQFNKLFDCVHLLYCKRTIYVMVVKIWLLLSNFTFR